MPFLFIGHEMALVPVQSLNAAAVSAWDELSLESVSKHYGRVSAVDNVSFGVNKGEFLTILGPSGSGKTTLLHMVAGFLFPDDGAIAYRGVNITYMPAHLRNMGMVFQNYSLFPHMTVADNLAFPLRMRRTTRRDIAQRVHSALELVGLSGRAEHLPSQLSGGQQQRVALARALVYQPSLLLMDEPLGALDRALRERLQMEIKAIQRATGVTVLNVTHDQQEALSMSDRIAVMSRGRLAAIGPSREIYERPPNLFVARAVGDCNFLPGRIVAHDGLLRRVELAAGFGVRAMASCLAVEAALGGRVTFCVRPESLTCMEAEGNAGAESSAEEPTEAIRAIISEVIYLGDIIRYELLVPCGREPALLSAKSLRTPAGKVLARGTEVIARWPVREAWIIMDQQ